MLLPDRIKSDTVEDWVTWAFVGFCFFLALFKDVFPWLDKGLTAALFAAVFLILRQLRDLRIDLRKKEFQEDYYPTGNQLYSSVISAIVETRHEICATYFRDTPPSPAVGEEARRYFKKVVDFARTKGTVRRIIKVDNPQLTDWCLEQARLAETVPRLNVRVLNPGSGGVEPMNVIILDGTSAYLSFAGATPEQVGGVRPPGGKHTAFLQARFNEHWRRAKPIAEFVRSKEFRQISGRPIDAHGSSSDWPSPGVDLEQS
ncbi:hypothetical protein Areg01_21490 [Actinoplanes regularis]|nr:hypothetical protein Areg01_21490 [Actinoplanes regularis]